MRFKILSLVITLAMILTGCAKKPIPPIQPPPSIPQTSLNSSETVTSTPLSSHFDMHKAMPDGYPK